MIKNIQSMSAPTSLKVGIWKTEYGTPQPNLRIEFPSGMSLRHGRAIVHALAAQAELATGPEEQWLVQVGNSGDFGNLHLELSDGDEGEAQRGMELLLRIAESFPFEQRRVAKVRLKTRVVGGVKITLVEGARYVATMSKVSRRTREVVAEITPCDNTALAALEVPQLSPSAAARFVRDFAAACGGGVW